MQPLSSSETLVLTRAAIRNVPEDAILQSPPWKPQFLYNSYNVRISNGGEKLNCVLVVMASIDLEDCYSVFGELDDYILWLMQHIESIVW
jgi:hypothetical protein